MLKKLLSVSLAAVLLAASFAGCDKSDEYNVSSNVDFSTVELEKIGEESVKVLENTNSVHISQTVDLQATLMGSNAKITVNAESDVNNADQIIHSKANANSNGLTMDAEMYVTKNGENASVYANINNSTWMKQDVKVAQLKSVESYNDAFESAKFFLSALEGAERTSTNYSGQPAILVKGVLDTKDPEGIIANAGFGSAMNSSGGMNTSMFMNMLTGLEAVDVSIYLDAATGLPLELKLDMTAFLTSAYSNLGKTFGQAIKVSVDHAIATMVFTNYNTTSVTVPDEVVSAVSGN